MKTKYKYIEFEKLEEFDRTIWRCRNRKKTILGHMVYFEEWHQWEWRPEGNMGFTIVCNDDISHFLRQLNAGGPPK